MLRVHRAALHGNNNMAVMPFPRDCPLAACLTSLELSSCNMFSLPAQACSGCDAAHCLAEPSSLRALPRCSER